MAEKFQTKMKVAVRIRPALNPDDRICVGTDKSTVSIFNRENIKENITYKFPIVFDSNSPQKDVYSNLIQPEVKHILEGQNVSIFAYGGTGSGKTHTISGSPSDPGVIPRLIQDLLDSFLCQTEHSYKMTLSYLEIYNEKIRDLITDKPEDLSIRQDAHQNVFIPNLTEKEVGSFEDFSKIFGAASEIRSSSKSLSLSHVNSSHSHGILLLKVIRSELNTLTQLNISKVFLVDLVSAEEYHFSGNEGTRSKEINKSWLAFIDVIAAINQRNTGVLILVAVIVMFVRRRKKEIITVMRHIPFRNGKLTRLLQNSLSGSSHLVMIANVAPEDKHYHNTYCTLNFASKHKKIVDNPAVNELATAYNIKLPNSKPKSDESGKAKRKLNSLGLDKSKTSIDDLKHQMLKLGQSLRNLPSSKTKVSPKEQKAELLNKTLKNGCKETMHDKRNATMKDDLKSKLNVSVKKKTSEESKKVPLFREIPKREINSKDLKCTTNKNNWALTENKEKEKNHRARVLQLLNSQSENDLLLLHTVGKRRAQLIIEWRENNEPFQQIEDLLQIPELGQKYLTQFLSHNHLTDVNKENL